MGAAPEDYLLTYSRWFHPTARVLYYPVFDSELLIRSARLTGSEPRTLDAYYVGKGAALGPCPPLARAIEVTRSWPENKSKLYDLLENVRIFYSYDWLSSTLSDAALMGCEVRLIGKPGATMFHIAIKLLGADAKRTLTIGDRLDTDVAGSLAAGLTSGLVLTGVATTEDVAISDIKPDVVYADLPALVAAWQHDLV